MSTINPFKNEEESIAIGELTVENRLDRIELYGSLQITKDRAGLQMAEDLKRLIDETVVALKAEKNLPERIPPAPPRDRVDNPFD